MRVLFNFTLHKRSQKQRLGFSPVDDAVVTFACLYHFRVPGTLSAYRFSFIFIHCVHVQLVSESGFYSMDDAVMTVTLEPGTPYVLVRG